jgi:DNA primase
VATPLAWDEVTAKLDPSAFSVLTVPGRLAKLKQDPWVDFASTQQHLPALSDAPVAEPRSRGNIVVARKPKPRAKG